MVARPEATLEESMKKTYEKPVLQKREALSAVVATATLIL